MLGFSINRVTGMSMHPRLPHNSFILLRSLRSRRANKLRVGDVVRCHHDRYGSIIKTIAVIDTQEFFWLKGEYYSSVSMQDMGPVHIDQISAKAIFTWLAK